MCDFSYQWGQAIPLDFEVGKFFRLENCWKTSLTFLQVSQSALCWRVKLLWLTWDDCCCCFHIGSRLLKLEKLLKESLKSLRNNCEGVHFYKIEGKGPTILLIHEFICRCFSKVLSRCPEQIFFRTSLDEFECLWMCWWWYKLCEFSKTGPYKIDFFIFMKSNLKICRPTCYGKKHNFKKELC